VGCPASYTRDTTVLYWELERPRCEVNCSPKHSADGKNELHYTSHIYTHGGDRKTFPLLSFTLINIIITVCDNIM